MGLPRIDTPTYTLELPSTGEEIKYRPFLVKEQKILMMSEESEDDTQMMDTIGKLVASCTFNKIDIDNSPIFDIEYIFLKLRSKSVGETAQINIICPDDGKTSVPVTIKIDDINVQMTEDHTNKIDITDTITLYMGYPKLLDITKSSSKDDVQQMFNILNQCVKEIHYGDDIYHKIDITDKDLNEFIDQLSNQQFEQIMEFFNTMPKLRHVVEVTNPKTKVKSEVVVEGLQSFLD
tara:strand:+ start:148 stop:852 length:705 start_codon:yes stop_codon:yes gene_type:complete